MSRTCAHTPATALFVVLAQSSPARTVGRRVEAASYKNQTNPTATPAKVINPVFNIPIPLPLPALAPLVATADDVLVAAEVVAEVAAVDVDVESLLEVAPAAPPVVRLPPPVTPAAPPVALAPRPVVTPLAPARPVAVAFGAPPVVAFGAPPVVAARPGPPPPPVAPWLWGRISSGVPRGCRSGEGSYWPGIDWSWKEVAC